MACANAIIVLFEVFNLKEHIKKNTISLSITKPFTCKLQLKPILNCDGLLIEI